MNRYVWAGGVLGEHVCMGGWDFVLFCFECELED